MSTLAGLMATALAELGVEGVVRAARAASLALWWAEWRLRR